MMLDKSPAPCYQEDILSVSLGHPVVHGLNSVVLIEMLMKTENLERINCPICDQDQTKYLFTKDSLSIVECKLCGLLYVNPRVSSRSLEENYVETYYPQDKIQRIHGNVMEWRLMEERLSEIQRRVPVCGRILDVGCGIGTFLHLAKEHGWETYGIDPSESSTAFAHDEHGLDVFCGDLFGASFPDQYFDVITLYHVLEHISHLNPLLDEIRRILKPETGCLVVEVPNGGSIQMRMQKENWPYVHPRDHLYYFSRRTLPELLRKHGFDQIRMGKPRRINPDKGMSNNINFAFRRAISAALVRFHLSTIIRVYSTCH